MGRFAQGVLVLVLTAGGDNAVGKDFIIRADYTFRSALCMVAPGGRGPVKFGVFHLPGYTRQFVLF